MPNAPDSPEANRSTARPLIERVRERVTTAAASLTPPRGINRRRVRASPSAGSDEAQELRALRRVFRDMGRAQRKARRQTGQPPFPAVREAAYAFQHAPSLSSLVGVAASLDEVGLLAW